MKRLILFLLITTLTVAPSILQAKNEIPIVPSSQFAKPLEKAIIKEFPVSTAVRTQLPIIVSGGGKKKENRIFISWMGVNGAIGYNIYRKDVKNKTLNLKMITPITDGNSIQNLIRIDSEEWPAIKRALGISDPSQFFYDPPLINQNIQLQQGNQFSTSLQQNAAVSGNSGAININPNASGQSVQPVLGQQSGSTNSSARQLNPNPLVQGQSLQPIIPGQQISNRALTRWALAQLYASVAQVMGLGFMDTYELKEGAKYEYEVRAVMSAQPGGVNKNKIPVTTYKEMQLTKEPVEVKCEDSRNKLTSPKEFTVYEGDQYLEILWPKDLNTLAYDIWKSDDGAAYKKLNIMPLTSVYHAPKSLPYKTINYPALEKDMKIIDSKPMSYYIDQTIMNPGDPKADPPIAPSVAYQVYNDKTYQYKIYPRDIMGSGYEPKNFVKATPQDRLEPASPTTLIFETLTSEWELPAVQHNPKFPCICRSGFCASCDHCNPNNDYLKFPVAHTKYSYNSGLRIRWEQVFYNIKGNPEDIASYTLYRYPTLEVANLEQDSKKGEKVGTYIVPQLYSILNQYIDDNLLKSETKYYYRLYVTDKKGHSNKSGIFTASIRDNKPPLAPENVRTTVTGEIGKTAFIKIHWDPSKDPNGDNDLIGYRIYRRVSGAKPVKIKIYEKQVGDMQNLELYRDDDLFRLVGVVYHDPKNPNQTLEFEDQSLPQPTNPIASGLVYQYCVKAFDRNENVSYNTPSNITCQRQQKIAGPKPPTITFLQSRSNSIRLEWVAPPMPDLYTFRIYRIEKEPTETTPIKEWTQVSADPNFEKIIYCDQTPPEGFPHVQGLTPADSSKPTMHKGPVANTYWFEDAKEIQPGKKYWYKIVSVDYWMNPYNKYNTDQEHAIKDSSSVAMSTYTYDKFITDGPTSLTASFNPSSGVTITWTVSGLGQSFILYRSSKSATDGFVPLTPALTNNFYVDATVRDGKEYWYKVQYVTKSGHYSGYSNVMQVKIPETGTILPGNRMPAKMIEND